MTGRIAHREGRRKRAPKRPVTRKQCAWSGSSAGRRLLQRQLRHVGSWLSWSYYSWTSLKCARASQRVSPRLNCISLYQTDRSPSRKHNVPLYRCADIAPSFQSAPSGQLVLWLRILARQSCKLGEATGRWILLFCIRRGRQQARQGEAVAQGARAAEEGGASPGAQGWQRRRGPGC